MNLRNSRRSLLTVLMAAVFCSGPLLADVPLDAGAKDLKKIEVTRSMEGFRDTLRFYVFNDAKVVLRVQIDNKDLKFPVSAKLYIFADDTPAEGIEKWINNQHSDGLFVDAAEPKATHEIPAASCTTKSHEFVKAVEEHFGKFNNYTVTFGIKDVPTLGGFKLKDFTDKASVNLKVVDG